VKFRSSLIRVGPFTAESAGQRSDRQEDDIKLLTLNTWHFYLFYIFLFHDFGVFRLWSCERQIGYFWLLPVVFCVVAALLFGSRCGFSCCVWRVVMLGGLCGKT
jgi:hypothetical protein